MNEIKYVLEMKNVMCLFSFYFYHAFIYSNSFYKCLSLDKDKTIWKKLEYF